MTRSRRLEEEGDDNDEGGGEAKRAHLIWIELEEPQETLEGLLSDLVREYLEQGDGKHERSSIAL
jgi:hypothetical protein